MREREGEGAQVRENEGEGAHVRERRRGRTCEGVEESVHM